MDRVHSDICGPMPVESLNGSRYLLTIIDEYSRMIFGFPIKLKSDAAEYIINWINLQNTQTGKPLKEFHSDGGGEFKSSRLLEYFK
jgi:transposase InsO family protein